MNNNTKLALVDDHALLRQGLAGLLSALGYEILHECDNGIDLMKQLDQKNLPDVVLMDIQMPEMDGYEATLWLTKNHPSVHVLALSMLNSETSVIRMIKNGARGYIMKDANPIELKTAIEAVMKTGFHYTDKVTGRLVHSIDQMDDDLGTNKIVLSLSEREIEFLKLASTEMTYKEIATQMCLSPRTIDGYRDVLFEKLNARSRIGLVLFSIRNGIIQLN